MGSAKRDDDCPEGLDAPIWKRFVDLREQKLQLEGSIRAKTSELADASAFLQRRAEEEETVIRCPHSSRGRPSCCAARWTTHRPS